MSRINIVKFREDVRKAKNELHITQKQLAKEAGVGHALLSKLFNKRLKYPTRKSVTGLCSALGLDMSDYYVDPMPELQREDVAKAYTEAKATLARANAMLDDAQTRLDELKARNTEDTPEAVANDLAEERLAALEAAQAQISELSDAELKFIRANDEIAELKQALEVKNRSLAERSREVDDLTVKLRDSDKLVLALLDFIQRLKDGDVER